MTAPAQPYADACRRPREAAPSSSAPEERGKRVAHEINARHNADKACVLHTAKLLPLAYLAPDLVEMILEGRQPPRLTLTALIAQPLPHSWPQQRARFAALR